MKPEPDTKTVDALLQWRKAKMLTANPEYQRGEVWTLAQQKRLIDSVLRGYPIPLIYLHHIKTEVAGAKREDFEIIDGQQRINAFHDFKEGAFKLFDPVADAREARFPSFIEAAPCPWGGKKFEDLDPALQQQFLDTKLSVVMIYTDVPNEARDLFIRLQAGMPLNSQEKRDAWPGNFTEFVLKIGGKIYSGHEFFSDVMKAKTKSRGDFRQHVAQLFMLYSAHRESGGEKLCDINGVAVDAFYYQHLDFDPQSALAKRFKEILDILKQMLSDGKRPKVIKHEAIHLVLLVDSLLDDYTRGWTATFATAFDKFKAQVALAKKTKFDNPPSEYWVQYAQLTGISAAVGDNILRRHKFFTEKMYGWLNPQLKDATRGFGALEHELIYYRDEKECQVCGVEVPWSDHEVHHVEEHAKGGPTNLDNGALVHKHCHPKGNKATADFADYWKEKREKGPAKSGLVGGSDTNGGESMKREAGQAKSGLVVSSDTSGGESMTIRDINSKQAVLDAVAEYDRIGKRAFLEKYGFGEARDYFLVVNGRQYDSKAIVGAAYGYQFPQLGPLGPYQFGGGRSTVQRVLESLDFTVRVTKPTEVKEPQQLR